MCRLRFLSRTKGDNQILRSYLHWGPEHLHGHHKHVATPKDPATAKLNQSVYRFLPQTYLGSWKSSYDLEMKRLKEAGQSPYSLRNRVFWYIAGPALYSFAIGKMFTKNTKKAMFFFYIQGTLAALLLELVNYLEHYGLTREKLPNGSFEPVDPTVSQPFCLEPTCITHGIRIALVECCSQTVQCNPD